MIYHKKRPLGVTWLTVGVLLCTSWSWLRFGATLQFWGFLNSLSLSYPPLYLAFTGLLWGVVGSLSTIGLWQGWHWAKKAIQITAALVSIQLWMERLIFTQSATVNQNTGFILGLNIAVLFYIFLILARENVQIFFGESHERKHKSED